MEFEITSIHLSYDKSNELKGARVIYAAKDELRTLNVSGNFQIDAVTYNEKSIGELKELARQDAINKLSEEVSDEGSNV